jgi:hypothetical protein
LFSLFVVVGIGFHISLGLAASLFADVTIAVFDGALGRQEVIADFAVDEALVVVAEYLAAPSDAVTLARLLFAALWAVGRAANDARSNAIWAIDLRLLWVALRQQVFLAVLFVVLDVRALVAAASRLLHIQFA